MDRMNSFNDGAVILSRCSASSTIVRSSVVSSFIEARKRRRDPAGKRRRASSTLRLSSMIETFTAADRLDLLRITVSSSKLASNFLLQRPIRFLEDPLVVVVATQSVSSVIVIFTLSNPKDLKKSSLRLMLSRRTFSYSLRPSIISLCLLQLLAVQTSDVSYQCACNIRVFQRLSLPSIFSDTTVTNLWGHIMFILIIQIFKKLFKNLYMWKCGRDCETSVGYSCFGHPATSPPNVYWKMLRLHI